MKIFDTHSHYNLEPLVQEWQRFWGEAQANGVKKTVVVGADLETSRLAVEEIVAEGIYVAVGCHPLDMIEKIQDQTLPNVDEAVSELEKMLEGDAEKKRIVAVGEIGLDFFRMDKSEAEFERVKKFQIELLTKQIKLAQKYDLSMIFHVRDNEVVVSDGENNAYGLMMKMVDDLGLQNERLVFHCFSGNREYLEKVLQLKDSYVSFAGNVTFKNAGELQSLVPLVPMERLMVETDAPFLAPCSKRGQFCQPAFIGETVEFLVEKFGISPDQLYNNAVSCFRLTE